jgi:hypothetical protein
MSYSSRNGEILEFDTLNEAEDFVEKYDQIEKRYKKVQNRRHSKLWKSLYEKDD